MKKREERKVITRLFSFLLMLLGFSACDNEETREMYGTPIAEFTVKGKVVRAKDKERPLSDIQVVIYQLPEEYGKYNADTLFTDRNGGFELNSTSIGIPKELRIIYEELEENAGEVPLKKGQMDVTPKQIEKGKGNWNLGKYEAEVEIEMEEDRSTE